MNEPTGPAHGMVGMKQRYRVIYEGEAVATSPEAAAKMTRHMLQVSKTELPLLVRNISANASSVEIMTGLQPLVTSENFGELLLASAQQAARYSIIARLMAGLETPGDLTEAEQAEHLEDLLEFLQAELDAAGKVTTVSKEIPDPPPADEEVPGRW